MTVTFSAQEVRNILSGLGIESKELAVLKPDDTVYVERETSEKIFQVYAVEATEDVEPLYQLGPNNEAEFGFFNRYYTLRDESFNTDRGSDPGDIPGVD